MIIKLGWIIVLFYLFLGGLSNIAVALNKTIAYWILMLLFGGLLILFWEAL